MSVQKRFFPVGGITNFKIRESKNIFNCHHVSLVTFIEFRKVNSEKWSCKILRYTEKHVCVCECCEGN